MAPKPPPGPTAGEISYGEVLSAIVKCFVRVMGGPAAAGIARRVPQLSVADDGSAIDYLAGDPLGAIRLLIDEYRGVFGESAVTLARQAVRAVVDDEERLLQQAGVLPSATPPPIRILLVDDHALFREGLAGLIRAEPDLSVISQAGTMQEAIAMTRDLKPDLVLMDITLPDGTGVEATQAILSMRPTTRIMMLTMHEDDAHLFAAVRAGAMGYLTKNTRVTELLERVRGVARGEAGISPVMARHILDEFSRLPGRQPADSMETSQLTAREIEILGELARGATNHEIAQRLVISEHTVRNHVSNVLAKLHLHSRRDAARYAREHGLIPPSPDPSN